MDVTLVLAGTMVWLGGKAPSLEEGMKLCRSAIWSGAAYEKFLAMVERQGGDARFLRDPGLYPSPAFQVEVPGRGEGYVSRIAVRKLGLLAIELGAGRIKIEDVVDPAAGIVLRKKLGDRVQPGEPLALLCTGKSEAVEPVGRAVGDCFELSPVPGDLGPRVRLVVDDSGVRPFVMPAIP